MGAVGNWISDAWKSTIGQAWEGIGINQLWREIGATDAWENGMDSVSGWFGNDDSSQTLNSSSAKDDSAITGITTPDTETTDDGSSGVEEKGNVGGEGAASVASQKQLAAKSSLVGSGLPTFGFTQDDDKSGVKTKKLGA